MRMNNQFIYFEEEFEKPITEEISFDEKEERGNKRFLQQFNGGLRL